jgi:hypothetical protein
MTCSRMNYQTSRFVEHEQIVVLVEDVEGNFLRSRLNFLRLRLDQPYRIAWPNDIARSR